MTQYFTVVEAQTEKKGVYVKVKDTIADVKAILDGKVDKLLPEDFLYIGTLGDIEHKISAIKKPVNPPDRSSETTPTDQKVDTSPEQKQETPPTQPTVAAPNATT